MTEVWWRRGRHSLIAELGYLADQVVVGDSVLIPTTDTRFFVYERHWVLGDDGPRLRLIVDAA